MSEKNELYKKYRPRRFADVIGQNTKSIEMQIREGECPQAIMVCGPSGCGKTTIGRIIGIKLKVPKADFIEINAANETGIDVPRKIQSMLGRSTSLGAGNRLWLIDECHRLTKPAQSGLLKILEDTPAGSYLILATTEPQQLLPTIRTRCTDVVVRPLSTKNMEKLLVTISKEEKCPLPAEVIEKIIDLANGSARRGLVLLNSIYKMDTTEDMINALQKTSEEKQAIEIARALFQKTGWKSMAAILKATQKEDPEGIRRLILSYCNTVILGGGPKTARAYCIIDSLREPLFYNNQAGLAAACYEVISSK
jgi:DNA polymerase III gamma/tau subunit